MIKPDSLAALFARSEAGDELMIGRVCRALVGGGVTPPLTAQERMLVGVIADDAARLDGRVEELRAKERERKRAYRAGHCPELSQGQDGTNVCPGDISVSHTNQSSIPSSRQPVIPSTNQPVIKTRTVPVTRGRVCAGVREGGSSGSSSGTGTGRGERFEEIMGWSADVICSGGAKGDMSAIDLYRAAFGAGEWEHLWRQLGERADERMLSELSAFASAWRGGEGRSLRKPAAAIIARLQRWLASKEGV